MEINKRRATYQDVIDSPEHIVAEKMPLYAALGVQHAWLVHPRRRTLEAFRLHEGQWLAIATHRVADRARVEPFDTIEIDLARLWADVALPTSA